MTQQADAGDIIDIETVEVSLDDRAIDLYRKLLPASERVLLRNLSGILTGNAPRYPQDPGLATTFPGRKPEDGRIDCTRTAVEIHNLVRAVAPPWSGAFCDLPAGRLVIQRARVVDTVSLAPGELIEIDGTWYLGMARGGLELLAFEIVPSPSVEVRNETSSPVRNVDS
jgi:methionyl-tRNA formyltransferase